MTNQTNVHSPINVNDVESSTDLEAIREGLAQSLNGQGRPISEFFAEFEEEHEL